MMKAWGCTFIALSAAALTVTACRNDSQTPRPAPSATPSPTIAATSDIRVGAQRAGATPFVAFVDLLGTSTAALAEVSFTVDPMPGAASKPVRATYTIESLRKRGRVSGNTVTLPVIGLYANRTNSATVNLRFSDNSVQSLATMITTAAYGVSTSLSTPSRNLTRQVGSALGFDYFLVKPNIPQAPVTVVDSDGHIRWASSTLAGAPVLFRDNGIDIADPSKPVLYREELDGVTSSITINNPAFLRFHHNLEIGREGILAEPDLVGRLEDFLVELRPDGSEVKSWDLAAIFEDYMRSQGDDSAAFVRRGADWFHINSAIYDPTDNTIIASSRENFVVKLDYETGDIKWLLGDSTKYWYSFSSLRSKALSLSPEGLVPIGQHALSIRRDGQLMMFNNGNGSLNMPAGTSPGETRSFSAVTGYFIDHVARTAIPGLNFDDSRSIYSAICSSAYTSPDGSLLILYSQAENGTVVRIKGLDPQLRLVFDYSYQVRSGCASSWNAAIVPFENLRFTN